MDFSDDSDDSECLKIHGFHKTDSSSSDSGKEEFDEIHEKLKPPPVKINLDEHHVVVIRATDKIEKPSQVQRRENNREKENNGKFINRGKTEKCRIVESCRSQSYKDVYGNTSSASGYSSSNLMKSSVKSGGNCKKAVQSRSSAGSRYVPSSQVYPSRPPSCENAKSKLVRPSKKNRGESSDSRKKNTLSDSGYKPTSQVNYCQCLTCEDAAENSTSDSGFTIQRKSPVQSSQSQNLEKTPKNTSPGSGYLPPSLRKSSVGSSQSQCWEDARRNVELARPSRNKSRVKSSQSRKKNAVSYVGYVPSHHIYSTNQSLTWEDSWKTASSDSVFPIQSKKEVKSSQSQKTPKNTASGSGYISPSLKKSSVGSSQPQCWEDARKNVELARPSRKKSRVESSQSRKENAVCYVGNVPSHHIYSTNQSLTWEDSWKTASSDSVFPIQREREVKSSQSQKESTISDFGYVPSQVNSNQFQSCENAWRNTASGSEGSRRKERESQRTTNEAFDPNLYQGDWNEIIDVIDLRLMALDLEEAHAGSSTEFLENVAESIGVDNEMYFALQQTEFEYHQAGIESNDWSVEPFEVSQVNTLHDQTVESFQQARKSEENHSFWNQILMGVLKKSAMVFLWDSFHCLLFELNKN